MGLIIYHIKCYKINLLLKEIKYIYFALCQLGNLLNQFFLVFKFVNPLKFECNIPYTQLLCECERDLNIIYGILVHKIVFNIKYEKLESRQLA